MVVHCPSGGGPDGTRGEAGDSAEEEEEADGILSAALVFGLMGRVMG